MLLSLLTERDMRGQAQPGTGQLLMMTVIGVQNGGHRERTSGRGSGTRQGSRHRL